MRAELVELIESTRVMPNARYFGMVNRPAGTPCTFTIFDSRITVKNQYKSRASSRGVVLSLDGKDLVGIWGYHLKKEERGVLIKTKCGREHRIEPDQEVTEILIDGRKVYP